MLTEGLYIIPRNPPVTFGDNRLRAIRSRLWQPTGLPFTTATALRLPFTQGGHWCTASIQQCVKSEFGAFSTNFCVMSTGNFFM